MHCCETKQTDSHNKMTHRKSSLTGKDLKKMRMFLSAYYPALLYCDLLYLFVTWIWGNGFHFVLIMPLTTRTFSAVNSTREGERTKRSVQVENKNGGKAVMTF